MPLVESIANNEGIVDALKTLTGIEDQIAGKYKTQRGNICMILKRMKLSIISWHRIELLLKIYCF